MAELGLFPLPIVLFPTERIPLHIFEERYKDLINECLDSGDEFGLVLEDEEGGLRDLGTRAAVVEVLQVFDDGRLNVVVEGRARFRLVELTEGRTFQTAEVEPVEEGADPAEPDEVERTLAQFRELVELAGIEIDEPAPGPALSFALAAHVDFGPAIKQELLELESERRRIVRLAELLEYAVRALGLENEARDRAGGNGRVTPRQ
jgi:Lon protease-like protein